MADLSVNVRYGAKCTVSLPFSGGIHSVLSGAAYCLPDMCLCACVYVCVYVCMYVYAFRGHMYQIILQDTTVNDVTRMLQVFSCT